MKLQRTTLTLLTMALILGSYTYLAELRQQPETTANSDETSVFAFEEDDIQSFSIRRRRQVFKFEPSPTQESDWQTAYPQSQTVDEATVVFLLDALVRVNSDRVFSVPREQLVDYGLAPAWGRIYLRLDNGETHRLVLGNESFDGRALYAIADTPADSETATVHLVSNDVRVAMERLWEELMPDTESAGEAKSTDSKATDSEAEPRESSTQSPEQEETAVKAQNQGTPSNKNAFAGSPEESDSPSQSRENKSQRPRNLEEEVITK